MHTSPRVVKRVQAEIETVKAIPELKIIRPKIFPDERGFFCESYNRDEWAKALNFHEVFKQDNHSYSKYGVIRGLHSQPGMGKLVSVVSGQIFDVAVDARVDSPTFGQWHAEILDAESKTNFWIPPGFLHGLQVSNLFSLSAHVTYKCTAVYDPKTEFGIDIFDESIGINWPIMEEDALIVSERDRQHLGISSLKHGNPRG
ncbi:DTDP-4-dehydrorhamnose 3,5-epimerase [Aphelenchoides besseyi]|nr:DTDP-4-dehydrorhamnose 3,5-epimerase [Aphelenchoides besseyi]KAI6210991.1 DTDP-4-dehydrorhamnose 3,5-epimerase [Aphelenchoides besseyi]